MPQKKISPPLQVESCCDTKDSGWRRRLYLKQLREQKHHMFKSNAPQFKRKLPTEVHFLKPGNRVELN